MKSSSRYFELVAIIFCIIALLDSGKALVSRTHRSHFRRRQAKTETQEPRQIGYVDLETNGNWPQRSNLTSVVRYSSNSRIKAFNLTESLNSTTLRSLILIRDAASNFFTRVFAGIGRKVQQDIRQTKIVSQEVNRRFSKTAKDVVQGSISIIDVVSDIPSTIQELSNRSDTWSLIASGVNPFEKPKLIGNFKSTNTAARVKKLKRVPKALTAASTIASMQTLPSKLKYDYERQVRRQEAIKFGEVSVISDQMLSESSSFQTEIDIDSSTALAIPLPYVTPYNEQYIDAPRSSLSPQYSLLQAEKPVEIMKNSKFVFEYDVNGTLISDIVNENNIKNLLISDNKRFKYYPNMDAYQILGVQKDVEYQMIKSAYRKLVYKWHPDRFPDDETKKEEGGYRMEIINRAWYCLSDVDRRMRYDEFGEEGIGSSAASEQDFIDAEGVESMEITADDIVVVIFRGFDVLFFLVESFIKAIVPIILGGGNVAWSRVEDTFLFLSTTTSKSQCWRQLKYLDSSQQEDFGLLKPQNAKNR